MALYVVTLQNQAMCSHGGKGTPMPPVSRVSIMSVPVVTSAHTYVIAGCSLASTGTPCATAKVLLGATRVKAALSPGAPPMPLVLAPGKGDCIPTANPLIIPPAGQTRVIAL